MPGGRVRFCATLNNYSNIYSIETEQSMDRRSLRTVWGRDDEQRMDAGPRQRAVVVTGEPAQRLADVVAAAVTVAAESAEAGRYTGEVGRTLAAVVGEFGARIVGEAELRGFSTGWQEAMAARPAGARPLRADPAHA